MNLLRETLEFVLGAILAILLLLAFFGLLLGLCFAGIGIMVLVAHVAPAWLAFVVAVLVVLALAGLVGELCHRAYEWRA